MLMLRTKKSILIIILLFFQIGATRWKLEYMDGLESDVKNKLFRTAINIFSEEDQNMGCSKICFKEEPKYQHYNVGSYSLMFIALNHYSKMIKMDELYNYLWEYAESHKKDNNLEESDIEGYNYVIEYSKPIYSHIDDTLWIEFKLSYICYSYDDSNVLDYYIDDIWELKVLDIQYKIEKGEVKILNTYKYEVYDG